MKEHKSSLQSFVNSLTPMEESEFLKIWELCEFKKIEKSSFFVQAGSQENKLGFVLSGLFKVYYTDSEGGERIRNFVGPGHPVAPYSDLILQQNSSVSAEAIVDCEILSIPFSEYQSLFNFSWKWERLGRIVAEKYMIHREMREAQFLQLDAWKRFQKFTELFESIAHLIPKKDVASYLGINPVSLSRLIKENAQ